MSPGPWFHLFGQPVNGYLLLYFIGIFPGLAVMLWMTRRRQLPLRFAVDAWALCLAAAVIGGWLVYAVADYGQWIHGPSGLWERLLTGGTTSMGALAGILLAAAWLVWRHPDARGRAAEATDIFPAAFAIYDAVARLGCFTVGCCHGRPAFGLPWAVQFPSESACVFRGMPVHPAQLYMTFGELALGGALVVLAVSARFLGSLIWVWMTGYGVLRFIVEFFRGDGRPMLGPMSINQWICLGFVAVGSMMLVRRLARPKPASADDSLRARPCRTFDRLSRFVTLFALRRDGWLLAVTWMMSFALLAYAILAFIINGFLGAWFLHPEARWTGPWIIGRLLLFAPLALLEEFFFRGLLQERWLRGWLGTRCWRWLSAKNIGASALFALGHAVILGPWAGLATFPASLVLGRVMEKSGGSLWPPVALHALANLALGWFALLIQLNTPWHRL